jgi:hypothetical protein
LKCDGKDEKRLHLQHNSSFLREEFTLLKDAKVFVCIGPDAWNQISHLMCLTPVDEWSYQHLNKKPNSNNNVTEVHGVLFEDLAKRQFVIPVTFGGNALRNSYREYIRDGLEALRRHLPSCA